MQNTAQKTGWGLTTKAVLAFSAIMFLGYILGGF